MGLNGVYYLNNTGHRWVSFTNGAKDKFVLIDEAGNQKVRTVEYYEAFGNFAVAAFKYKGKRIKKFFESFEKIDDMPVVRLKP